MKETNGKKTNGKAKSLSDLRRERGLSQRQLAEQMGISRGRLRHLEQVHFEEATFGELKRMAEILQVELGDLLLKTRGDLLLLPDLAKAGEVAFQMDLPQAGCRIVSPHLPRPEVFSGRLLVKAKKRIAQSHLPRTPTILLQVLLGSLQIELCHTTHEIQEGDSFVFSGEGPYTIANLRLRDAVAHLLTVPSFLAPTVPLM